MKRFYPVKSSQDGEYANERRAWRALQAAFKRNSPNIARYERAYLWAAQLAREAVQYPLEDGRW